MAGLVTTQGNGVVSKFLRTNLNTRYAQPTYRDLKRVKLSPLERQFFCRQLLCTFADHDEIDIIGDLSQNQFIDQYNIPRGTARGWLRGQTAGRGRPNAIDSSGMLAVFDKIAAGTAAKRGGRKDPLRRPSTQQIGKYLCQARQETSNRQGKDCHPMEGTMDDKTIQKYKKFKIDGKSIQSGKGQVLTQARYNSKICPTLAIQRAVTVMAVEGNHPATNKWNVDGTTCLIEPDGARGLQYRIINPPDDLTPLESTRHQQGLNRLVKYLHLNNANGDFGPLCLIICVPGMPENAFFHTTVVGLTNSTDSTQVGHLYFAKNRAMAGDDNPGPHNGWNHYFSHVLIPTIAKFGAVHEARDDIGDLFSQSCNIDGELTILKEAMSSNIMREFLENSIDLSKVNPSGTNDHQASDVSPNFRDLKTGLRMLNKYVYSIISTNRTIS